jgi:hypothetical protein
MTAVGLPDSFDYDASALPFDESLVSHLNRLRWGR